MERGNLAGVSESVLDAVAQALRLDEAERDHLFDLARAASTSPAGRPAPQPSRRRGQARPAVRARRGHRRAGLADIDAGLHPVLAGTVTVATGLTTTTFPVWRSSRRR